MISAEEGASEMGRDDDLAAGDRLMRHGERERVPARSGTGTRTGGERRHGGCRGATRTSTNGGFRDRSAMTPRKRRVTFTEDETVELKDRQETGLNELVKISPVWKLDERGRR